MKHIEASVEERFEKTGFVYVGKTRIMFAPEYMLKHQDKTDQNQTVMLGSGTGGWPMPTQQERLAAINALRERYGDCKTK